jgi:hypothetical protein
MPDWAPHLNLQAELRAVEARLASEAPSLDLLFSRAALLHALSRLDEAKAAYVDILKVDACHLGTLTQLGALLYETDYRSAAITVYKRLLSLQPRNAATHVSLANVLWDHNDHAGARRHYEAALELDPESSAAHQGMAAVLNEGREGEAALEHLKKGFSGRPLLRIPYRGTREPLPVLVLSSASGGNIPLRRTIDDRIFKVTVLVVEFHDPAAPLPPHPVVFNAIGEADQGEEALRLAANLLEPLTTPVLNDPRRVMKTGRAANALRLGGLKDLVVPAIKLLARADLERADAPDLIAALGLRFPLLLRAQGFHGGKHFVKLDSPAELKPALATMPGLDFAVIEFMDARSADGEIRKYRVMLIDGKLHPLHAAVSKNWKIHYFSADMVESAAHRAEDEAFLLDMPAVLGPRAMAALEAIRDTLGLDYAGVDFSVDASGALLFYEANATMVIAPPDAGEKWAYRRAPVQKVFDAVTAMLKSRIAARI